jgi:hypothetical protein
MNLPLTKRLHPKNRINGKIMISRKMAKLTKLLVSERSETDATEEKKNERILFTYL